MLCAVTSIERIVAYDGETRVRVVDDAASSLSGRPTVRTTQRDGPTSTLRSGSGFDQGSTLLENENDDEGDGDDKNPDPVSQYQFKEDGVARLENTGKVYLNNVFVVVSVALYTTLFMAASLLLYSMWGTCLTWATNAVSTLVRVGVDTKKGL
jgi:hypothetical protein